MKKIAIILLFLFYMLSLFSQEMKISTPAGEIKMSVSDINTNENITKKEPIVDKIADKLELLTKKYCSKLNKVDQKRAKRIIDEIYDLLAMLPDDVYINNQSGENFNSNSQTQNLNITIKTETSSYNSGESENITTSNRKAMNKSSFQILYNNVKEESFSDDKLAVIRTAANRNYFKVSQLIQLLDLFSFENDKIKCVEIVYPKIIDKENAHQILNSFTYSSDKQKVEKIINK